MMSGGAWKRCGSGLFVITSKGRPKKFLIPSGASHDSSCANEPVSIAFKDPGAARRAEWLTEVRHVPADLRDYFLLGCRAKPIAKAILRQRPYLVARKPEYFRRERIFVA